jgi:hypothetical protein
VYFCNGMHWKFFPRRMQARIMFWNLFFPDIIVTSPPFSPNLGSLYVFWNLTF